MKHKPDKTTEITELRKIVFIKKRTQNIKKMT